MAIDTELATASDWRFWNDERAGNPYDERAGNLYDELLFKSQPE